MLPNRNTGRRKTSLLLKEERVTACLMSWRELEFQMRGRECEKAVRKPRVLQLKRWSCSMHAGCCRVSCWGPAEYVNVNPFTANNFV